MNKRAKLDEDAVMAAGDCAAPIGDVSAPADSADTDVVAKGTSADDVLGKDCDHHKEGYMSTKCFHIPSNIIGRGKLLKRAEIQAGKKKKKKDHKNPYEKDMQIISEAELTREMILGIHSVPEEKIAAFIRRNWKIADDEIEVVSIAYCPVNKTIFIKFKSQTKKTQFVQADFNGKKFSPVDDRIYSTAEVKREFKKILDMVGNSPANNGSDDIKLWVIWGAV